jgi:TPR repeat protein
VYLFIFIYFLAECYASGNGTSQNIPESVRWIKKAADEAQDLNAMKKLAYMYEQGIHVPQDLTLSQKYFHTCAEKNSVVCQHKLGEPF